MAEFNPNIWAPWRMEYIRSLDEEEKEGGCFLCRYWENPRLDREHHVVWRTDATFVVMNRFPYTNGHLLIAHGPHRADVTDLSDAQLAEITWAIRDGIRILRRAVSPHGFNIGYNIGPCAGAGLPDHLHAHLVPRWSGDTNFMAVVGDHRVIPEALDTLWAELVAYAKQAGLRD